MWMKILGLMELMGADGKISFAYLKYTLCHVVINYGYGGREGGQGCGGIGGHGEGPWADVGGSEEAAMWGTRGSPSPPRVTVCQT